MIPRDIKPLLFRLPDARPCERCGICLVSVTQAPVRTAYSSGEQPQPLLCPDCLEDWNLHWDEMWDNYNSGRLSFSTWRDR